MFLKFFTARWRSLRRIFASRPIYFTRFGTYYILFSLAVGGAAINTGNNLLYLMLGLLLGLIIISGVLSDSCLWGLDVAFQPIGDFYMGQPAEWDLVLRKGWFPGVILQIEAVWDLLRPTRYLFYWVPRRGTERRRVSLTPDRRGRLTLKSIRYSTRFPFGLFEKSRRAVFNENWVVFPRVRILPLSFLQAAGVSFSDRPAMRKGWGVTPFDIREYQAGESSKRIHWKSTAKRARLMVTEMEEESAMSQTVGVARWPQDPGDVEPFISFVASLVYTLWMRGQPVGLQTPGAAFATDTTRAHLKNIFNYLALVDPPSERAMRAPAVPGRAAVIDASALWERPETQR